MVLCLLCSGDTYTCYIANRSNVQTIMSTEMDLLLDSQMDEHERFMEKGMSIN